MTANVEDEEAKAIAALVAPSGGSSPAPIALRDFARPRRLSAERHADLQQCVQDCLPQLTAEVLAALRIEACVELNDMGELDCRDLFEGLEFPAAVLCFDASAADGESMPSWAIIDGMAAVNAADCALGAGPQSDSSARSLTSVEQALMQGFLDRLLTNLSTTLGITVESAHLAQSAEQVARGGMLDQASDAARLYIHLQVVGEGIDTLLRFYLPCTPAPEEDEQAQPAAALPPAFGSVSVDLGVYLGCVDVPLQDLLALEHGDVIPLGVEVEEPLRVYVEDRPCATARWGKHSGQLAVQIESLGLDEDDYHQLGLQQSQTETQP